MAVCVQAAGPGDRTSDEFVADRHWTEGWEVVSHEVYSDAGASGRAHDRPGLCRLERDVQAGQLGVVVCASLNRLSRDRSAMTSRIDLGENWRGDAGATAGAFPPVIGVEPFDRVQRRLVENVRTRANHRYLLKGRVRCRRGGSMLTPRSVENKRAARVTRYYRCTRQRHFASRPRAPPGSSRRPRRKGR